MTRLLKCSRVRRTTRLYCNPGTLRISENLSLAHLIISVFIEDCKYTVLQYCRPATVTGTKKEKSFNRRCRDAARERPALPAPPEPGSTGGLHGGRRGRGRPPTAAVERFGRIDEARK